MKTSTISTTFVFLSLAQAILAGPSISHAYGPSATLLASKAVPTCSPTYTCPRINGQTSVASYSQVEGSRILLCILAQTPDTNIAAATNTREKGSATANSNTLSSDFNAAESENVNVPGHVNSQVSPSLESREFISVHCAYSVNTGALVLSNSLNPSGVCSDMAALAPCGSLKRAIPGEWATREQKMRLAKQKLGISRPKVSRPN
ncbi:hypothetical protein VNI00_011028 [Paramarasmius palmivorus]|uniref:Uncharacterized protein n=1 Tax=Paramarasmius palmivorus TaxID=297713 RepID=A0AAW0CGU9_9AGAR